MNNLKLNPRSKIQRTPQREFEAQEQPKKSLYFDKLTRKRSNTVIRRKSSEINIQVNKQDTIQILRSLNINDTNGKVLSKLSTKKKRRRIIDTPNQTMNIGSAIP